MELNDQIYLDYFDQKKILDVFLQNSNRMFTIFYIKKI